MALPDNEWLAKAQALAVGQTKRTYHNEESRANLIVGNDIDRWWSYCHRCHEGGVVMKEHVVIGAEVEQQSRLMPWPSDALPPGAVPDVYRSVYSQMLRKGIDLNTMLPGVPMFLSVAQGRLLLGSSQGWLGRAIGPVQPKWCCYGQRPPVYAMHPADQITGPVVLTEDYLSALKLRWSGVPATPVAVLGTSLHTRLMSALLPVTEVFIAFDGDKAGRDGTVAVARRLRGLGKVVRECVVPDGLDPKDMHAKQLRELIRE